MEPVALKAGGEGADSDKCSICLSLFEKQAVASLENCQHVFCLHCILQWSQTANTCPVDRISFALIHQRQSPGGAVLNKIKVKMQKKNDDDDDDEEGEGTSPVICEACGRSDRRHRLLVCIQCDSGHHMDCLTPSLDVGPEADWICPDCVVLQHTDSSMVTEEISDGEITDLLADVDDAVFTSRRLRPSTMNHRSRSAERRRSQRIQSRASRDPGPRPQTLWHVPKYLLQASKPSVTTDEAAASHHSDTSSTSVKVKTRKRRKRAT